MFLENPEHAHSQQGWVEVICGSMFSGKTEELIRRLKRARIAGLKVDVFKPTVDQRYSENQVVTHDTVAIDATVVDAASSILLLSGGLNVIGIDEAQFFDSSLVDVANSLANMGIRVIIAGLDTDYRGKPFGSIPALMAIAEYVTKVHAICMKCGNLANFSHRKTIDKQLVLTGETDLYQPLCRSCYFQIQDENKK